MSDTEWAAYDEFPDEAPREAPQTIGEAAQLVVYRTALLGIARQDFHWAKPDDPGPRVVIGPCGAMARAALGLSEIQQAGLPVNETDEQGELL